jgi:hypothetical protein
MKLPDFTLDQSLNDLRKKMGAIELRAFVLDTDFGEPLTIAEVERLGKEGIDIPLDDVQVLADGTLAYKGRRVVLYIRDVKQYRESDFKLPRFHVSDCETLHNMRVNSRFERYVVATRDTGVFQVRLMAARANQFVASDQPLRVCQFCLAKLDWNNFTSHRHIAKQREQTVSTFALGEFFERFGRTFVSEIPLHTEMTAPENTYTKDFLEIAERIKKKRGYQCSKCGVNLFAYRRFLHGHHKNGLQYDNRESNIELLCIEDHAAVHSHMRGMRELQDYRALVKSGKILK